MLKRLFSLLLVLAVILTGTAAADEQVIEIRDGLISKEYANEVLVPAADLEDI